MTVKRTAHNKKTQTQFLEELRGVWGDRWDYSKVEYRGGTKPITLSCHIHGEFEQRAGKALRGQVGCKVCNGNGITSEVFIQRARKVWGDRWDYSKTVYHKRTSPITVICRDHGEFQQDVYAHLSGSTGCRLCSGRNLTTEEYVDRASLVWGDRWDYSNTVYTGATNKVKVECRKHGVFEQIAHIHLRGHVGCQPCLGNVYDNESYIRKVTEVWEGRWDYSNTNYTGSTKPIDIVCKVHGEFRQGADVHSWGHVGCKGCVEVGTSTGEQELLSFIESQGFEAVRNERGILPVKSWELDAYLPQLGVAFEYNGVYWHSEKFKDRNYHFDKWKMCNEMGINLFQVWEDDWRDRKEIVKRHIRRVLNVSDEERVHARKLEIREIPYHEASLFLESTHIQGPATASAYVGGFHNNTLVAIALFAKRNQGDSFELIRYSTSALVRGGHSKMVAWFEKNYSYDYLLTFADLTFGSGELYKSTGWSVDKVLRPDYSYLRSGSRAHKFGFRIDRFKKDPKLRFEEGMTERDLARMNNLPRIYDAGKIRFVKPHPNRS